MLSLSPLPLYLFLAQEGCRSFLFQLSRAGTAALALSPLASFLGSFGRLLHSFTASFTFLAPFSRVLTMFYACTSAYIAELQAREQGCKCCNIWLASSTAECAQWTAPSQWYERPIQLLGPGYSCMPFLSSAGKVEGSVCPSKRSIQHVGLAGFMGYTLCLGFRVQGLGFRLRLTACPC